MLFYKKSSVRKACCLALSFSLAFSTLLIKNVKASNINSTYDINRLYGSNRYETSVNISKYGYKTTSTYLIIASGEDYADALCSVPLAKKYNCPVILCPKDYVPADTFNEIKRLNPKHVLLMGLEGALSKKVEDTIKSLSDSIEVERIGGSNRYETSLKAAEVLNDNKKVTSAALCSGNSYADALSIASAAGISNMPILLTKKDSVSKEVKEFIDDNNLSKVYVIGGSGVISDDVKDEFKAVRLGGQDRYDTNSIVLNEFKDLFSKDTLFLAVGGPYKSDFADALSGSALAAVYNAPVLLVDRVSYKSSSSVPSIDFSSNVNIVTLGGDKVLPDDVVSNIVNKVESSSNQDEGNQDSGNIIDQGGTPVGGGSSQPSNNSSEENELLNEINKCSRSNMRSLIEKNKEALSLSSSYDKLTSGRKNRVGTDLFDNKPSGGFKDIDEVKQIISELVKARVIIQESVNDVNNAQSVDDIKDMKFLKDVYEYLNGDRKFNKFSGYLIDDYSSMVQDTYDDLVNKSEEQKEKILEDILKDRPYESYGDILRKLF